MVLEKIYNGKIKYEDLGQSTGGGDIGGIERVCGAVV